MAEVEFIFYSDLSFTACTDNAAELTLCGKGADMNVIKKIARKTIGHTRKSQDPECLTFNEAVNFEKKCIFVAIPKTGTTSVRSQLRAGPKKIVERF